MSDTPLRRRVRSQLRKRVRVPAQQMKRRILDSQVQKTRGEGYRECSGADWTVVESTVDPKPTRGIYLYGACDLPCLYRMREDFRTLGRGTYAIHAPAHISMTRPDVLLQSLDGLSSAATKDAMTNLALRDGYFEPRLFEPEFTIGGFGYERTFSKDVVVLTMAAGVVRSLMRHRDEGFVVDPGGWWLLQDLGNVSANVKRRRWLTENFESVGRMDPNEFTENFGKLVAEIQQRVGAHVLVFNTLTVEPHELTYRFKGRKNPESARRREYLLNMHDLAEEMGFHMVDVDGVLKQGGINEAVDFAHFPTTHCRAIASQAFDILRDLEVA